MRYLASELIIAEVVGWEVQREMENPNEKQILKYREPLMRERDQNIG